MNSENSEEMRHEYDLRPGFGVRGKYYERYIQGTTIRLVFIEGGSLVASTTSSVGVITKLQFAA